MKYIIIIISVFILSCSTNKVVKNLGTSSLEHKLFKKCLTMLDDSPGISYPSSTKLLSFLPAFSIESNTNLISGSIVLSPFSRTYIAPFLLGHDTRERAHAGTWSAPGAKSQVRSGTAALGSQTRATKGFHFAHQNLLIKNGHIIMS